MEIVFGHQPLRLMIIGIHFKQQSKYDVFKTILNEIIECKHKTFLLKCQLCENSTMNFIDNW